jgi:hypothetical protein
MAAGFIRAIKEATSKVAGFFCVVVAWAMIDHAMLLHVGPIMGGK